MTIAQWASEIGIKPKTLSARLNRDGWDIARALTTSRIPNGRSRDLESAADRIRSGSAPDANGCWIWHRAKFQRTGYGLTSWGGGKVAAHRLSYEAFNGPIPDGALVCHRCDVRACVNPEHLFLGTARDNAIDMVEKGRDRPRRGAQAASAKLTAVSVAEIRRRYAKGETQRSIARSFGVSECTVWDIVHKRTWRHLG